MSRGGIITSQSHIGRMSFLFLYFFIILLLTVCFVGAGSWAAGCFWLWQTALVYSVPVGGMYCIYNLCFVQLLLFENHMCCENLGMTARLSIARSVPVLTAVVTVVSDSPASSIPFYSQRQRFFELLPYTNQPWLSPSFFNRHFCWDRSSHLGSRWAAVDCGAMSTSGQALQLRISMMEFFCPVTC